MRGYSGDWGMTRTRNTQRALVLRTRAYRESSLLVDFFTRERGRVSGVQKGYRSRKSQRAIQPFLAGELDSSMRPGLVNIYAFDTTDDLTPVPGDYASGFYLLELIFRAIGEGQEEPDLYDVLLLTLAALKAGAPAAVLLRQFERRLLEDLGYGVNFDVVVDAVDSTDEADSVEINDERGLKAYTFTHDAGLMLCHSEEPEPELKYTASELVDIAAENYDRPGVISRARRLFQYALIPLIGDKPLESRKLLDQPHSHEA